MTSGTAASWAALIPITRRACGIVSGVPAASRNVPERSASTPAWRNAARSSAVSTSYRSLRTGCQEPMPTTAWVSSGKRANAAAVSGWRRTTSALAGSDTNRGA